MSRFFRWLKRLFKPAPDAPRSNGGYDDTLPSNDVEPEKPTGTKRIAIIVGHTKSSKGAGTYKVNGESYREYDWNKERALEMKEVIDQSYQDKDCKIFYRDGIGRKGVAAQVGKWKADISLELHFNSIGHNRDAFGSEMLILKGDDKSAYIGYDCIDELCRQFKTKKRRTYRTKEGEDLRGIKALARGDRGFENLNYLKRNKVPSKLLIEPFFGGTKTSESEQFIQNPQKYSRVIGNFLGKL